MCLEVPWDEKAEPAVGFPSGWRFYFAEECASSGSYMHEPVPGLYILSPGAKKFRSVETAAGFCHLPGGSDIAREFYTHVGLSGQLDGENLLHRKAGVPEQLSETVGGRNSTTTERDPSLPKYRFEPVLSKYRKVGSRVFYREGKQGRWGIITKKSGSTYKEYIFTVRPRSSRESATYSIVLAIAHTSFWSTTGATGRRQLVA